MSQAERNRLSNKDISVCWRDGFRNDAVNRLHAEAFGHRLCNDDWWAQVNRHSLGWVCAKESEELIGFVNVAWDGALHAFILDTMVARGYQRRGMMRLANETGLTREGLYKALSKDGNPSLGTVLKVVEALGLKLTLQVA